MCTLFVVSRLSSMLCWWVMALPKRLRLSIQILKYFYDKSRAIFLVSVVTESRLSRQLDEEDHVEYTFLSVFPIISSLHRQNRFIKSCPFLLSTHPRNTFPCSIWSFSVRRTG